MRKNTKCPKMRTRTKNIKLKYHRFRYKVKEILIAVKYIKNEY